ncbi:hypothetical protein KRX57_05190 [Weeksellaceae bacterium TAE3-ERU29]|nr:hypothetical protein [Weeksellaceae bacterium TAE3-ERU29]
MSHVFRKESMAFFIFNSLYLRVQELESKICFFKQATELDFFTYKNSNFVVCLFSLVCVGGAGFFYKVKNLFELKIKSEKLKNITSVIANLRSNLNRNAMLKRV